MAPNSPVTDRLYHPGTPENWDLSQLGPREVSDRLRDAIRELLDGSIENIDFPVEAIRFLTREQVQALESRGLVISGVSEEHPDGGIYLNDSLKSGFDRDFPIPPQNKGLTAVTATGFLKGATGLITRPAIGELPKDLSGLKRFPMNSVVAAVFKNGQWTESHVLPDGRWIVDGYNNAAFQYAEGVFEGMVATDTTAEKNNAPEKVEAEEMEVEMKNGKITLFRPEENAKRFQRSCHSVGLPQINVDQFVAAVTAAVKNNKNFIPKNGKLYCRPFMVGLEGGTGINPASSCLFAVEVSPYGTYLPAKAEGVDLQTEMPGSRLKAIPYQRPPSGKHKNSGNYGAMIRYKQDAKKQGFDDILLIDDKNRIQECASNNVFLVEHDTETHFNIYTSSLESNILPGITRASILELLRDKKIVTERFGKDFNVTVYDDKILPESKLLEVDGAFGSGTAAGIGNFHEIQMTGGRTAKYHKGTDTQKFIKKLYDLLQDLRRGNVSGYEHWVKEVA